MATRFTIDMPDMDDVTAGGFGLWLEMVIREDSESGAPLKLSYKRSEPMSDETRARVFYTDEHGAEHEVVPDADGVRHIPKHARSAYVVEMGGGGGVGPMPPSASGGGGGGGSVGASRVSGNEGA